LSVTSHEYLIRGDNYSGALNCFSDRAVDLKLYTTRTDLNCHRKLKLKIKFKFQNSFDNSLS